MGAVKNREIVRHLSATLVVSIPNIPLGVAVVVSVTSIVLKFLGMAWKGLKVATKD